MVEPTSDQQRVLKLIYTEFQRKGQCPTYQWIDKLADRDGLSLRRLLSTMPSHLMTPDPQWQGGYYWRKETELLVTVRGLLYCGPDAAADLDLLARVLRYFADRENDFSPTDPHVAEDIVITSAEVSRDLGLGQLEIAKVYTLLNQFEAGMRFGSGGTVTNWQWTLDGELIRKYRLIDDRLSYLRARGDLPDPEPKDLRGRALRAAERLWLRGRGAGIRVRQRFPERVGAFAHHPLVVAVVTAVVTAVLTLYLHR